MPPICLTTDELIDLFAATAGRRFDCILWHDVMMCVYGL